MGWIRDSTSGKNSSRNQGNRSAGYQIQVQIRNTDLTPQGSTGSGRIFFTSTESTCAHNDKITLKTNYILIIPVAVNKVWQQSLALVLEIPKRASKFFHKN